MTVTEKILAKHAGKDKVVPGEIIDASVDYCMGNEITGILAIQEFAKLGVENVFDPKKIIIVPSHTTPAKDIRTAEILKQLREFAEKFGVEFVEIGRVGIEHVILPERGLVAPGELIVGGDSHTCTYGALGCFSTGIGSTDLACTMATGRIWLRVPESIKFIYHGKLPKWVEGKDLILFTIGKIGMDGGTYKALEFTGEAIHHLPMHERLTVTNMTIEGGGKNGIMIPDNKTLAYVKERVHRPYTVYESDPDANYLKTYEWDVSKLEPQIAFPYTPDNVHPISDIKQTIRVDQVVIGSCTNGRFEDLENAACIMKGRKVHPKTRVIVLPGSQEVYIQAVKSGAIQIFAEAGVAVSPPTCGVCFGGHMGIVAGGEVCVSTTNRNFRGRMGHPEAQVYLCNPAVAAAAAIAGSLVHPDEVLKTRSVAA